MCAAGVVHGVRRLRHDAVREHRLVEVDHVVDDHVGAELVAEREDVLRELHLSVEGAGEAELGAGSHVVDQLQHGAAFVAARVDALLDHGDGREIAAGDVLRRVRTAGGAVVEGVRERADPGAPAIDAAGLRRIRLLQRHGLALDAARMRLRPELRPQTLHARHACGGAGGAERQIAFGETRVEAAGGGEPEARSGKLGQHLLQPDARNHVHHHHRIARAVGQMQGEELREVRVAVLPTRDQLGEAPAEGARRGKHARATREKRDAEERRELRVLRHLCSPAAQGVVHPVERWAGKLPSTPKYGQPPSGTWTVSDCCEVRG